MVFEDALLLLKQGENVRRNEWDVFEYIYIGMDAYGNKAFCNSVGYVYNLSTEDVLAEDWEKRDE